jgi:predicted Na+-dependent transporter
MAGGEAAVAAGLLIGSTVAAVAVAGPILALEAGRAGFSPGGVIGNLALVVVLPLAAGIALRASAAAADARAERSPTRISLLAWLPATTRALATPRAQRAASHVALAAVAALVALIAAEVHFSAGYAAVAAALVVFLLASAVVGRLLGLRAPRSVAAPPAHHVNAGLRDRSGPCRGRLRPGRRRPAGPVRHPRPGLGHRRRGRAPPPDRRDRMSARHVTVAIS